MRRWGAAPGAPTSSAGSRPRCASRRCTRSSAPTDGDALAGYVLARVLEGEFGRSAPGAAARARRRAPRTAAARRGRGRCSTRWPPGASGTAPASCARPRRGTITRCSRGSTRWASGSRRARSSIAPSATTRTTSDARSRRTRPAIRQRRDRLRRCRPDNTAALLARDLADVRTMSRRRPCRHRPRRPRASPGATAAPTSSTSSPRRWTTRRSACR